MTKAQGEMMARLTREGFSWDDANRLRLISMTLSRWAERECGDDRGWCIERDETTGKVYQYNSNFDSKRYRIPDRETGALKRLEALMTRYPEYTYYHQGDPRGPALYILRRDALEPGLSLDAHYTRGIAVF